MFNRYIMCISIVMLSITASENNKPQSLWIKIFPSQKTANKTNRFRLVLITKEEIKTLITKEEIKNKEGN